jgi:hypothetical protein
MEMHHAIATFARLHMDFNLVCEHILIISDHYCLREAYL